MLYPIELRARCRRILARNHPWCDRPGGRGRGIRTPDIQLPKLALYQTELYPDAVPAHDRSDRRAMVRLRHHVGQRDPSIVPGCSRKRKSRRMFAVGFPSIGAPGEIRTPDHQVRSLVLYPAELRAHWNTKASRELSVVAANTSTIQWRRGRDSNPRSGF